METIGIICEYNPLHRGHIYHIEQTRSALGSDSAVVCAMSGNFVQRGDFAVFNKHSRAQAAVMCGADLVLEIPSPYALSSAEGFARAGVHILEGIGVCDHISFGSESGDIAALEDAAKAIASHGATAVMKEWLKEGLPYAAAQQKAADTVLGKDSDILRSPNNLLGIEYLKALASGGSTLRPMTIRRTGGSHDGDCGYSASYLREKLLLGETHWEMMPDAASEVFKREIEEGRGPISMKSCELAMLSRLREAVDFSALPGATEGIERRLSRCAASEATIAKILEGTKTKRYAMSRIRRMLMCACLGITSEDTLEPPPYIRVLAMNRVGMGLLKGARKNTKLPIITKPSSAKTMPGRAARMFSKEAAATDFYVLAYQNENYRTGGQEWRQSPRVEYQAHIK